MSKTFELFTRYLGAGAISTSVHMAIFVCLLPSFGATLSTACAAITGSAVAYGLARHWVFVKRRCAGLRFFITCAVQVSSNTFVVALLSSWGTHPYLAQMLAMFFVTIQGFTINHLWVFKHDIERADFQ